MRQYENGIWKGPVIIPPEGFYELGEALLTTMRRNSSLIGQIDAITGKQDTFGDMVDRSVKCALWLKKLNIKPDDIVAVSTGNHLNSIIPVISTLFVGAIFNPWWDNDDEDDLIRYYINLTQTKIVFASETMAKLIKKITNDMKVNVKIIVFGRVEGLESFDDILTMQCAEEVANFKCVNIKFPKQPALLLYTSGTTGNPKAVVVPYQSLGDCRAFMSRETMGRENIGMNFSTLAWISGVINPLEAIFAGSSLLIHYGISETDSFKLIDKYKVYWITMGTGIANRMSKDSVFKNRQVTSVKYMSFGGACVKHTVSKFLVETFINAQIRQLYGLTETGGSLTENVHPYSCGKVIRNFEIKVMSEDGKKILGPNEEGEIYFRSPYMMLYYYKNPKQTEDAIDDEGWFHTGDLAYYNADGEFFITDRIRELIKYRLHHVPPGPIEELILSHPGIYDVAVVAKPNIEDIEQPIAFVMKIAGANVTEDELIKLVDKNMSERFKLRGGVQFLTDLPRTFSGKISKKHLRAIAAQIAEKSVK